MENANKNDLKTTNTRLGSGKTVREERSHLKMLTVAAMLMAMNIVLSLSIFSIPVPGGHFYLNDCVICTAALLLDLPEAIIVGALGSFLGDLFFYPAPMFVTLVTRAIQTFVITGIARSKGNQLGKGRALVGLLLGQIIMVIGYTLGRAFVYATPEYSIVKLPYEILQAGVGAVFAIVIVFHTPVLRVFNKMFRSKSVSKETSIDEEQGQSLEKVQGVNAKSNL